MKISVLVSTYNGEKYLEEQLNSILSQVGDFELKIIVRDDGSSDSTCKILEKYANEGKLEWYRGNNCGSAKSFLDLLFFSRKYDSDYFAFADQDDYWISDKISSAIDMLEKCHANSPVIYSCNAYLVDSNLKYLGRTVYRRRPRTDFKTFSCAGGLLGCTMVFNRKMAHLIQEKEMPDALVMHDFYIGLVCLAQNGIVLYDDNAHLKYRQHSNNQIGVSRGTISKRIISIITPSKASIADQAKSIVNNYNGEMATENESWLIQVSNYKNNIMNRLKMASSMQIHFISFNMSVKLRLSILFGNR